MVDERRSETSCRFWLFLSASRTWLYVVTAARALLAEACSWIPLDPVLQLRTSCSEGLERRSARSGGDEGPSRPLTVGRVSQRSTTMNRKNGKVKKRIIGGGYLVQEEEESNGEHLTCSIAADYRRIVGRIVSEFTWITGEESRRCWLVHSVAITSW